MPPSQTPRQVWAQQRIDEVYADNAHPYFAKEDHRKGRLNAAMLRLNQETAPPNRPLPGQQVISAASLMGDDAFAEAEDAADFLTSAAGKGAAPKVPGAGPGLVAEGASQDRTGSFDGGKRGDGLGQLGNSPLRAQGPIKDIDEIYEQKDANRHPAPNLPHIASQAMDPTTKTVINIGAAYKQLQFDPEGSNEYIYALTNLEDGLEARSLAKAAHDTTFRLIAAGKLPDGDPIDNAADAFRHAYWSYQMQKQLKKKGAAKAIGDGHEQDSTRQAGARLMDLYNNEVGRQLAADPANAGRSGEEVILRALRDGKLRISPYNVPKEEPGFLSKIYSNLGS